MNKNLRIAITGHTSGLGKSFFEIYTERGYATKGYSRQNGFDLSQASVQEKLMNELSKDINVFINNAHSGWVQCELLYKAFELWKNDKKTIINIGSISSDGNKSYVHEYAIQKSALEKAASQLNNIQGAKCRVILIKPGWILNERTSRMNIGEPMLSSQHVIDLVDFVLNLPLDVHIPSISICRLEI